MVPRGDWGEGTPQGGPLSLILSNIALDEFDWELRRRGMRFVRYADDCNIFVRRVRARQQVMASVRRLIEQRLRLQENEEKSKMARQRRFTFSASGSAHQEMKGRQWNLQRLPPRVFAEANTVALNSLA